MTNPVLAGLVAGALWGLTFVAPYFIGAASAGELVIVRYLVYGFVSIAWLWRTGYNPFTRLDGCGWFRLVLFGALGNSIYYLLTVMSVRAGSAAVTALVIGTLPVMLAIVGNMRLPVMPWPHLLLVMVPILLGLVLVTSRNDPTLAATVPGLILALAAMASWLAYGLANASYMTSGAGTPPMVWSALVGLGTVLTLPFVALGTYLQGEGLFNLHIQQYHGLIFWGLVLGTLSSWLATWLWNIASAGVSSVVLGYLLAAETLFALFYAFLIDQRWPETAEIAAIALLIGGTLAGMYMTRTIAKGGASDPP